MLKLSCASVLRVSLLYSAENDKRNDTCATPNRCRSLCRGVLHIPAADMVEKRKQKSGYSTCSRFCLLGCVFSLVAYHGRRQNFEFAQVSVRLLDLEGAIRLGGWKEETEAGRRVTHKSQAERMSQYGYGSKLNHQGTRFWFMFPLTRVPFGTYF